MKKILFAFIMMLAIESLVKIYQALGLGSRKYTLISIDK